MEEKQIFGYVYLIKNLVNGKMYFGITENDFDTRYGGDISKHTHNDHLKRSIKKYGIESFEINEQFDVAYNEDDLYDLEDMYMCIYNTLDPRYGYNKRRSGSKHKGAGKPSKEVCEKISNALKGKPLSEGTKQKMSEATKGKPSPMKGKQLSEEHKQKLSEALGGEKHPMYGRPRSEETKRKISEATKGKHRSEETRKKMSESHKGKYCGAESSRARAVICLDTLDIFATVTEAEHWCGSGAIGMQIKGQRKSAGKHPITKQPLHWMYYEDYLKLQEEQQNKTQDLVTEVA